jgi:hypothetical protein
LLLRALFSTAVGEMLEKKVAGDRERLSEGGGREEQFEIYFYCALSVVKYD